MIEDYEPIAVVDIQPKEITPSGFISLAGRKLTLPSGSPVDLLVQALQTARAPESVEVVDRKI